MPWGQKIVWYGSWKTMVNTECAQVMRWLKESKMSRTEAESSGATLVNKKL